MKKLFAIALAAAAGLCGQQAETIPFRAVLSTANEVPAITGYNASGTGTLWVHVVRQGGRMVSGSVDFQVDATFPGEATITGTHIHSGAAGTNGPVVIDSGVNNRDATVAVPASGAVSFLRQGQGANDAAIAALEGLLRDPSAYYLNVHTTTYAGGVIRGQLMRASMTVLMGRMQTGNEVPAVDKPGASALGAVTALATWSDAGALTSARVIFDASYTGLADATLSGFHIHSGRAGANGPVTINTGLRSQAVGSGGAGTLRFEVEVDPRAAAQVDTVNGLFSNPNDYYINLHTTEFPGGVVRSQLYGTGMAQWNVLMSAANEVPPIAGLNATAPAVMQAYFLRGADGGASGGLVVFDVNHRFPGAATFTGLHIHDGRADANGGVTINTGLTAANNVATVGGAGNIYRTVLVTGGAALATLNSMLLNPENHYVNLHTSDNPGGAVRAQIAPANAARPVIDAVISAVSDPTLTRSAPLGLITIFGSNLSKVPGDLGGFENLRTAPTSLNGTQVLVGAGQAAVLFVGNGYLIAQLPADAAGGVRNVVVRNSNGESAPASLTVQNLAPGIFFDANGGVVVKAADGSYVGQGNPARSGEVLVFFAVGLGQTTPELRTGEIAPGGPRFAQTVPVTATIGGQNAPVVYSVAMPGYVGLYQIAVRMPAGVTGNVPLVLSAGTPAVASNSVRILAQ